MTSVAPLIVDVSGRGELKCGLIFEIFVRIGVRNLKHRRSILSGSAKQAITCATSGFCVSRTSVNFVCTLLIMCVVHVQ